MYATSSWGDIGAATGMNPKAAMKRYHDVIKWETADPLIRSMYASKSWQEIARATGLSPTEAMGRYHSVLK